jgi:hypothetical protein
MGCGALPQQSGAPASVRTSGQCKFWKFRARDFQALVERQPGLAFHIAGDEPALAQSENVTLRDLGKPGLPGHRRTEGRTCTVDAQERLEAELAAAQDQQSMLPNEMPDLPGWFAALCASRSERFL